MTDIRNALIARSGRFNKFGDELILHEGYSDIGDPGYFLSQETTLEPDEDDDTPGYFRSPMIFYALDQLDFAKADLGTVLLEFSSPPTLESYPASWAAGLDLDSLRKATDEELRATLEAAVRDGIETAKAGVLR